MFAKPAVRERYGYSQWCLGAWLTRALHQCQLVRK